MAWKFAEASGNFRNHPPTTEDFDKLLAGLPWRCLIPPGNHSSQSDDPLAKKKDEKSTRWHKHCVVALKKLRCCPQKANTAQEPPLGSFGLVAHLGGTLVRCEDWDDTPRRPQNGRCSCAKLRKQVDSGGPTLCSNFQTDMSLLPEFFRVNLAGIWVLKVSPHWFIDKRETGRCEVARTN